MPTRKNLGVNLMSNGILLKNYEIRMNRWESDKKTVFTHAERFFVSSKQGSDPVSDG